MLPSRDVHRLAGFALLLVATVAHADDPRDLFGLGHGAATTPPADCRDGRTATFGCALATDPLADAPTPYALATWLPARYLLDLPVADATHDSVASYALGAATDGAGVVLGGATGQENRWTIDGAPVDGVRTGTADAHVPLVFLDGILVTGGGFGARDRVSTGGTIDARLRRGGARHVLEAYAWVGVTASPASAPTPNGAYTIRSARLANDLDATVAVVGTGPLGRVAGGTAWYAAGIAPTLAVDRVLFQSHRLVDANGDGVPDPTSLGGFPGPLATAPVDRSSTGLRPFTVPAMLRVGWDRGPHHIDLTVIGQDQQSARYFGNATVPASGVDLHTLTADGIATYRGEWTDTHVKVQAAWHHAAHRESATDPTAAHTPQVLDAYLPAGFPDASLVAGCAIGATPKFTPCPVPTSWLVSGGAGLLTDTTADRPTVSADITHRVGANTLRAGVTNEDSRLSTTQRYTGGSQLRSLFDGQEATLRFIDPSRPCDPDPALPCTYTDSSTLVYRTRYSAGYLEDTFQLAPDLVANGGLRWEMDQVGGALVFHDEPAPRFGVAWDPLGGGQSRVWASAGRSYPLLVAGLGSTLVGTAATSDDQSSAFGQARVIDLGLPRAVASGIEPMYQDELTAGIELGHADLLRVTAWVQARYLRQGFDTTFGTFDNPGRRDPQLPEATRDTQVWALEVATAPGSPLALRAGYTYTQVTGTWTGPYDPRQGLALFSGADYDQNAGDLFGRLPTDLAHRVFVEAGRHGHAGPVELGFSTRLTVASGRPLSVLADSDEGIIELLPRGTAGRLPMTSQANMHLSARWRGTAVTLDVFDLFDRTDPSLVGEVYASRSQSVRPIVGGQAADLVFLRTQNGLIPDRDPSFRLPTSFQAPFAAVLGARRNF